MRFMYYEGQGVVQSYNEALVGCRNAADQGQAIAQFIHGQMFEKGQCAPKSTARALSRYRKAEAQGDKESLEREA